MLGYKLPLMEKLNLDFKLGSGYFVVTKQAGKTHINDLDILEYNLDHHPLTAYPVYNR